MNTEQPICVVRLSTSYWWDASGLNYKRRLHFLKRKCRGVNELMEQAYRSTAKEALESVVGLYSLEDGLYQVTTVSCPGGAFHKLTPYNELSHGYC